MSSYVGARFKALPGVPYAGWKVEVVAWDTKAETYLIKPVNSAEKPVPINMQALQQMIAAERELPKAPDEAQQSLLVRTDETQVFYGGFAV